MSSQVGLSERFTRFFLLRDKKNSSEKKTDIRDDGTCRWNGFFLSKTHGQHRAKETPFTSGKGRPLGSIEVITIKISSAINRGFLVYLSMALVLSDHNSTLFHGPIHAYFPNLRYFIKTYWQSFVAVGNHQIQHTCNEFNVLLCDEQATTTELAFYARVITFKGSAIVDEPPAFLYYCVASSKRFSLHHAHLHSSLRSSTPETLGLPLTRLSPRQNTA